MVRGKLQDFGAVWVQAIELFLAISDNVAACGYSVLLSLKMHGAVILFHFEHLCCWLGVISSAASLRHHRAVDRLSFEALPIAATVYILSLARIGVVSVWYTTHIVDTCTAAKQ